MKSFRELFRDGRVLTVTAASLVIAFAAGWALLPAQDLRVAITSSSRVIRVGRTSAEIKAAIAAASAGDTLQFIGSYDVSDWGGTPYVIDKQLHFTTSGHGVATLTGTTAYDDKLFDVRASLRVEGLKFKQLAGAFEFNQTNGGAIPFFQVENCEFEDVVRPFYSPDTYLTVETLGITRLLIEACYFTTTNLTLHDPALGARVSDGEACIELQCPIASADITHCYADPVKKTFVRIGFSNTSDTDTEAAGWNRINVSENVVRNVYAGTNGSTNNAGGILIVGRTAIVRDNRIDTVVASDDDEATGIFVFAGGDDSGNGTAAGSVIVDGNRLFNCGGRDGAISLKGDTRAAATNNPPNWRQQITNNSVLYSDAFTAARTLPSRGMWCQVEDVLIAQNIFDRCVGNAIHIVSSNEGANTTVAFNLITNHRINDTSDAAIHVNAGNDVTVGPGNRVFVTPQGTIAGRALRLQPDADGARKRWEVIGNTFSNSGGGSASRAIMVVASSDIEVLTITGHNQFVGWQQGIRFDTGTISRAEIAGNWFDAGITTPIELTVPPTRYTFADNPGRVPANVAFTDQDATPSVARVDGIFTATYTAGPTAISNFDDGIEGQVITVLFSGTAGRPQHNANLRNSSAADYTLAAELDKRFRQWRQISGVWYEQTPAAGSAVGP